MVILEDGAAVISSNDVHSNPIVGTADDVTEPVSASPKSVSTTVTFNGVTTVVTLPTGKYPYGLELTKVDQTGSTGQFFTVRFNKRDGNGIMKNSDGIPMVIKYSFHLGNGFRKGANDITAFLSSDSTKKINLVVESTEAIPATPQDHRPPTDARSAICDTMHTASAAASKRYKLDTSKHPGLNGVFVKETKDTKKARSFLNLSFWDESGKSVAYSTVITPQLDEVLETGKPVNMTLAGNLSVVKKFYFTITKITEVVVECTEVERPEDNTMESAEIKYLQNQLREANIKTSNLEAYIAELEARLFAVTNQKLELSAKLEELGLSEKCSRKDKGDRCNSVTYKPCRYCGEPFSNSHKCSSERGKSYSGSSRDHNMGGKAAHRGSKSATTQPAGGNDPAW